MPLIILLVLAVALFALAFFTRRRFGVLGLALTAGVVLSEQATGEVATFLQLGDFPVEPLTYKSAAVIVLLLAPALLLLFSGPRYNDQRAAAFGGVAFAVFGTVLLLAPLSMSLPLASTSIAPLLTQIALNTPLIIATSVILAVIDTMHAHAKKPVDKKGKH